MQYTIAISPASKVNVKPIIPSSEKTNSVTAVSLQGTASYKTVLQTCSQLFVCDIMWPDGNVYEDHSVLVHDTCSLVGTDVSEEQY